MRRAGGELTAQLFQADMAAIKADLSALETRLTKHIYTVVFAGVGLTVTLTTVLLKLLP